MKVFPLKIVYVVDFKAYFAGKHAACGVCPSEVCVRDRNSSREK